ncbi:N-acetylglucosamine-6-phosphate deacetylase [candidate division BRC1 bacterium HGW-BRC1-1]|nr:MAG: N-acetylglucosamine-6-phosphate deacetylase [candidate division BRC1 bacterium HGW-BRC1-1]
MIQSHTTPQSFKGIAIRRLHTPRMILDNVLIEFDGTDIGVMGDFAGSAPPGYFDARGAGVHVVPGMVDVHNHGCGGVDFLDASTEDLQTISMRAAAGGTTTIVPTITFANDDPQLEGLAAFTKKLREFRPAGARLIGIHLEGPFLNPERRGAFRENYLATIDIDRARHMLEICGDLLLKITMAPELKNADELIELFTSNPGTEVEVSLGHSTATYEFAQKHFAHPRVRQVTHAFNAMHSFHHREPGLIGAALLNDDVTCEMIPDGQHLAPPTLTLLHRLKGSKRLILVTDSCAATGLPLGASVDGPAGARIVKNEGIFLADGTLTGSNIFMADAVQRAHELGGIPWEDALEMATLTPAVSIHRDKLIGSIEPGKRADFCVLDTTGQPTAVIRDGLLVAGA